VESRDWAALDCRALRRSPLSAHELAELNVAVMKEPLDSPSMAELVAAIARVDQVAEAFTFRKALRPPDRATRSAPFVIGGECPA
jgi:hypothetical protein